MDEGGALVGDDLVVSVVGSHHEHGQAVGLPALLRADLRTAVAEQAIDEQRAGEVFRDPLGRQVEHQHDAMAFAQASIFMQHMLVDQHCGVPVEPDGIGPHLVFVAHPFNLQHDMRIAVGMRGDRTAFVQKIRFAKIILGNGKYTRQDTFSSGRGAAGHKAPGSGVNSLVARIMI